MATPGWLQEVPARAGHRVLCHGTAILLLACISAFYLATIRQGNTWGDDFALYIRHAENVATGKPYADTGYLYNPAVPIYGPPTYPPVFPLLLVPVYHFSGLNFWGMKCEQVAFFILALLVIYLQLLHYTSRANASLVIAIVGFNPNFWAAKDNVLSDLPFLFFFWLAAWLASRASRSWRWAVLFGAVLYLAVGTRIIGIALLAGFVISEVLSRRKLTLFALIPAAICLMLLAAQIRMMALGQGSSFDLFHPTLSSVTNNFFAYGRALATFWVGNSKTALTLSVVAITTALAALGAYVHARRRPALLELSLALYLATVILWPGTPGLRLLYPVIPFYVYLVVAGLSFIGAHSAKPYAKSAATAALVVLLGFGYITVYRHANWHTIPETDGLASFNDLCRRLQMSTNKHDVFLCRRPRALTLFARRRAAVYDTANESDWWRFAEKIHASYLICNRQEAQDTEFLLPLIARSKANLDLVYQNADFELYRIRSSHVPLMTGNPQGPPFPQP